MEISVTTVSKFVVLLYSSLTIIKIVNFSSAKYEHATSNWAYIWQIELISTREFDVAFGFDAYLGG